MATKKPRTRELMEPTPGDKRFVRRDAGGKFKDVVDVGKSLAADRRSKSKTAVKSGQGDRGDVKRTASKASAKKSATKAGSRKSAAKSSKAGSSSKKTAAKKAPARKATASKKSTAAKRSSKSAAKKK